VLIFANLTFQGGSESPLSGQDNHLGGYYSSSLLPFLVSLFCYGTHVILQELCICSSEIAEKEDIYQLGVILLEVITGQLTTSASEVNELKLQVFIQLFLCILFLSCTFKSNRNLEFIGFHIACSLHS
jgi:hypothetical protein